MAHRSRGARGAGGEARIGRGRPAANQVMLDEVRHIRTRLDALETSHQRDVDISDISEAEESSEEEAKEETPEEKMVKMIMGISSKPRLGMPMYEGVSISKN